MPIPRSVVLGEHGQLTRLIIYENDGTGFTWTPHVVDPGGPDIDHHDGALTVDFDGDGDLDIVSLGWHVQGVWLFENRAFTREGIEDTLPPTMPTQVMAQPFSSQRIDLSWQRSIDDFFILRYEIYRDGALAGTTIGTSFTDTGLSENTPYSYEIVAIDAGENASPASTALVATTPFFDPEPPTVPGALTAASPSPIRVDLSWTVSTDNRAVIGYRLYRDSTVVASLDPAALAYSELGLLPASVHLYQLTAVDAEGNESDAQPASQSITTAPPVTGLWAAYGFEESTGTSAKDSSPYRNDGVLEAGAVRSANGRFGQALELYGTSTGDVSLGILGNLDFYSAHVTIMMWIHADDFVHADARLISKSTSKHASDHLWMLSTVVDAGGTHLRARLRTSGATTTVVGSSGTLSTATWIHAAMTYDGATLRLYQDGAEVGSAPISGPIDTDPTVLSWIGANPGQIKQVFDGRIDEVKILGTALSAAEIQSEMNTPVPPPLDQGPPTVPTNLQAVPVAADRIDLSWDASTDDIAVDGYNVYRDGGLLGTTPTTGFSDSGLAAEMGYGYEVSAFDSVPNESNLTGTVFAVTPAADTTPPVPSPLTHQASVNEVILSWAAASDNVAVAGYRVFRDESEIASVGSTGSSHADTNLVGGQTYSYALTAFDASGNESDPILTAIDVTTLSPDSTLFLYHRFEEASGDSVVDLSGFANHGLLETGAIRTAAGLFGEAIDATGSAGHVDFGPVDVVSTDALTIMLWLNADDFGTVDARLIAKSTGSAANDHVFMLSTIGGPYLRARLRSGGATTTLIGDEGLPLSTGTWIHAAMTYDGSMLRLYQDGSEVGSVPMSGPIDLDPTVETWLFANPGEAGQVFDGRIDEVKFYASALSPAEIEAERFNTNVPAGPLKVPALPGAAGLLSALSILAIGLQRLGRREGRGIEA